jgi:competence protein ComEC
LVSGGASWAVSAALLPLAAAPVLFRERIRHFRKDVAIGLVLAAFLVAGLFSGAVSSIPSLSVSRPLAGWTEEAALRLKALIAGIPFPSAGTAPLLTAFLTGDRSLLQADVVAAFRQSGASHLLALSGLHMGILYLLFDKLSHLAGHSPAARVLRYVCIVLAAGFFTLMTGASPSLVRAFLFIVINETLRLTGRRRKPSRVLCLALLVQLVLNPGAIREVGFQLSYLAMAGIFLLYPVLERWYPASGKADPFRRIWQAAALSISCQVFTGPLVWYRFHTFPRYFLLTNLLSLPLTTVVMACGAAAVGLSAVGLCPVWLITTTDTLCNGLQRVLEIISSL